MTSILRRTKIVTTLGPSTDKDNVLEEIIKAGANVVRMNFSHGTSEDHIQRANKVRAIAAKLGRQVAILAIYKALKYESQLSKMVKSSSVSETSSL